jgi:cell division protein FtsL
VSSRAAAAAAVAAPSRRVGQKVRPVGPRHAPRRVSGPARRTPVDRNVRAPAAGDTGIVLGLIAALETIANHRLLDRLLRGRAWIGLVAFALIGIVTMQLGLLKLSGGIGRAIEREALLQRENAALSIENSELSAGERVQSLAMKLGMELVPAGALRFLTANPRSDFGRGAAALSSSAHAGPSGSEESGAASSAAAQAKTAGEETHAAAPESQGTATEESSAASAESSSSGESRAPSHESSAAAGESSAATTATPAPGAESASAPSAGNSSAEATPAGGTQAGPQG